MNTKQPKIILLFLSIALNTEIFSATIVNTYRYSQLADWGGPGYSEGVGPSVDVTQANMYWSYWGKITLQSDPNIPIINAYLRFQSNPDQPNADNHLYYISGSWDIADNPREHSGTNLGLFTTEFGDVNRWDISWSLSTRWDWWGYREWDYQTIQGTATLVVETASGFDELATYPIIYTGATTVPEVSVFGFVMLPCFLYVFRRRRNMLSQLR